MEINFKLANGQIPLSLSPKFILPEDKRPLLKQVPNLASIPIIDLEDGNGEDSLVERVSKACEEYGFFQVVNHGVSEELCQKMLDSIFDFFSLPAEERAALFSEERTKPVKVSNYYLKGEGQDKKVTMWSEVFNHPWDRVNGEFIHLLPSNAPQYREAIVEYGKEIGLLMSRILGLISKGLGLDKDCLEGQIGGNPRLRAQANYYPPCPDPELTLGLPAHTDMNALTILLQSQGVTGLQVIKDANWVSVDPLPNAFVVNLGDQIQVMSNGRYKSVHHRAVTNKDGPRVSLAMFYGPNNDIVIGPIKELIDEQNPPLYRNYHFSEFLAEFVKQEGTRRMVKEVFELTQGEVEFYWKYRGEQCLRVLEEANGRGVKRNGPTGYYRAGARWRWLRYIKQMPLDVLNSSDVLPRLKLSEPGGSLAEVLLHGGQVVSWKNEHGEELLFVSSKAIWNFSKPIRGGISICFPQFGNVGSLFHRSPRNRLWSLEDSCPSPMAPSSNQSSVDLIFRPTKEDMKIWPHRFELRTHISLSPGKLTLIPRVKNTDDKPFTFTFSLSNYLSVSDISEVRVEGLETLDYFDNLLQRKRFTEQADAITFDGEELQQMSAQTHYPCIRASSLHTHSLSPAITTKFDDQSMIYFNALEKYLKRKQSSSSPKFRYVDRVYLNSPSNIAVIDHEKKKTFVLHKIGMPDAVVWNPWEKMAKALPDLGDQDYKKMLYVCSAAVENPIVLKPLEEWKGIQEICAVSSSYCSGQLDPQMVLHCLTSPQQCNHK